MARPTKLTPDLQEKICQAIRAGNYLETAAAYAGISKVTLHEWMRRGRREMERVEEAEGRARIRKKEAPFVEFLNSVEKALAEAEVRDVILIGKAAEVNWQAAAWRLERKFPDRWGRRERQRPEERETGAKVVIINDKDEMRKAMDGDG